MSLKQPPTLHPAPHHGCKNSPQESNLDNGFPITNTAIFVRPQTYGDRARNYILVLIGCYLKHAAREHFCFFRPEIKPFAVKQSQIQPRWLSDFYFFFVKGRSHVHPVEAADAFWFSICERLWLFYLFILRWSRSRNRGAWELWKRRAILLAEQPCGMR